MKPCLQGIGNAKGGQQDAGVDVGVGALQHGERAQGHQEDELSKVAQGRRLAQLFGTLVRGRQQLVLQYRV